MLVEEEEEQAKWLPFRNASHKSDRKKFDEMWDIPRLYASACSNSCQLVPLHPIIISILFQHYKELKECISEVEQIQEASRVTNKSSKKKQWLTTKEEEEDDREKKRRKIIVVAEGMMVKFFRIFWFVISAVLLLLTWHAVLCLSAIF